MSIYKSYFSKNNTIISDSPTNTGKNPVTELFYGGSFSRFLFQIDLTNLLERIDSGFINKDRIEKHTLKLTNTINPTENSYFNEITGIQTKRAGSFTLVVFELESEWDGGTGYDYTDTSGTYLTQKTYSNAPSNWFYKTTTGNWSVPGAKTSGSVIGYQHFDDGTENLEIDITNYINDIIDGNKTNNGLGIAFDVPYEEIQTLEILNSVAFFTKHTQSFFEPYLETEFNDHIIDHRGDFYSGVVRNLVLYTNKGNEPYNLDSSPYVDILNSNGDVVLGDQPSIHVSKGVYVVEFTLPNDVCEDLMMFNDVWKDLSIDGNTIGDVTQEFVVNPMSNYYNLGSNEMNPQEYGFSFSGIGRDEKIVCGDIRKIYVDVKVPFTYNEKVMIDGLQYRLFITEGNTNIEVIDWVDINRTFTSNYFLLDTSMLIPNKEYHLDLRLTTNREVNTYSKEISFYIVNNI